MLSAATQAAVASAGEYRLGSGDKILVTVFGHQNMSGKFSIAGNGSVSLPFVGSVKAGGLTVRELQTAIINLLKPDYLKNPRVSVEVLNFRPFDIIGEVKKPGSYPYRSGMTIINAVAMAGGFTYRAKENGFRIKRATSGTTEKAQRSTVVLPGDVIEVLERWF
jgi:polysaccharide export outer membrane protein